MVFDFFTRKHKDLNKPIPEFRKNDLRHASIHKSSVDVPNGLVIEMRKKPAETGSTKKEFFVKEIVKGGIFEKIHGSRIQAGDRLVKVNDRSVEEFRSLWDINDYLKKELKITIHVKRDGLHLEQKEQWDEAEYTPGEKPLPKPFKNINTAK
jgi:C-terminal processing protease CtpA/Prc